MIDIHSHILFGVDDGAMDLEESLVLINQALETGYTDIICTSHYKNFKYENKNYDKNYSILKKELLKKNISINLYKGNEIFLDEDILNKFEYFNTLNNSKYILVEFPLSLIYKACKKILEEVISKGYIPIIAHIERYEYIKTKEFIELYKKGVIFQVNFKSINKLNKKIKFLLESGYVKVLATDSHNKDKRNYDIKKELEKLKEMLGEKKISELTYENPRKIIRNEAIDFSWLGGIYDKKEKISIINFFRSIFKKLFSRNDS